MENKKNSSTKQTKWNRRKTIVALSAALGVAGVTAIVAPVLVSVLKKGGTTPTTETIKLTFNAGEHGSFTGGESKLEFTCEKGQPIGSTIMNGIRESLTTEENYSFSGWYLSGGDVVSESTVLNEDSTITAKYLLVDTNHININFAIDSANESLSGITSNSITIEKGKTYSEIKDSLPVAVRKGHKFHYWTLTKESTEEISPDYPFESTITLYPYFELNSYISTITFRFEALSGQTLSGTTQFELEDDNTPGAVVHPTWASITTWPTVTEGSKAFSGWYKDSACTEGQEWTSEDEITSTQCTAYAKMIDVNLKPTITFAVPENPSGGKDPTKYTFYGTTTVKCTGVGVSFDEVNKPIPFYDPYETDPTKGVKSNWYFKEWYILNEAGQQKPVPGTINKSLVVYPEFDEKPTYTFSKYDKTDPSKTTTAQLDPNSYWKEVATPVATTSQEDVAFVGWQEEWEDSEQVTHTKEISPDTQICDIDSTHRIVPHWEGNCNVLEFQTDGTVGGVEKTDVVTYTSNTTVGAFPKEESHTFGSLNIPIPTINTTTYPDTYLVGWDIYDEDTQQWSRLSETTEIEGSEVKTTYKVRPALETKVSITFDVGEIGKISSSWGNVYKTTSDTEFSQIYTPTVAIKDDYKKDYQFQCWGMDDGEGNIVPVDSTATFSSDITLHAMYDTTGTTSIVNFYLKPEDDPETCPYKTSIAGTSIAVNHTDGDGLTFDDIPHATATKHLHNLVGWDLNVGTKENPDFKPIEEGYVLPCGGNGIDVYARFEIKDAYHIVSVKTQESNDLPSYEIIGDNKVFIQDDKTLPINDITHSFGIEVKSVGYEVTGWTDAETGDPVTTETKIYKDLEVLPVLTASKRQVILSKDGDDTITGFNEGDSFEIDNYGNLQDALTAQGKNPQRSRSDFVGWQTKVGDTYTTVDENTVVTTATLTVVPLFRGESEFAKTNQTYFYDSEKKQWAAITSFDKPELQVYYANGDSGTKDKSTFNYEVRFGSQMTSVPDNFMLNCTAWNNGNTVQHDDNTLKLPSRLLTIGNNVMKGCHAFNQKIDFSGAQLSLKVGDGFMTQCYAFDQDIDLSYTKAQGALVLGSTFMHECQAFTHTINFSGRTISVVSSAGILTTNSPYCAAALKGFYVKVASAEEQAVFTKLLPASKTTAPYRNYQYAE